MRNSDDGFTLAETLVALVLTLIVIGGAIATFTKSMSLAWTSRDISETNHGLQAAMSLMVRDFIQTGEGVPLGGVPVPSGDGANAIVRPGPTALTFPAGTTIPAMSPGAGLGPTLIGVQTDMVTLLYADATLALNQYPLTGLAADGSTMTVDPRTSITGTNRIKSGDIILFSNALGNAVQMVTATPTTQTVTFAGGDALGFNQRAAAQGTVLQLQSGPGVFPPTTATRLLMITYYIDNATDPTLPRLVRRVNNGNPLAIAMGVENYQVSYDFVDGVTNPSNVDTTPAGNSPNQIRKANLFLSARSEDIDHQTNQYFRNSMATDVGLRSLSFANRYN